MGDRYISQNALISEIAKIPGNLNTRNVGQAIWDTPTADVVEVVRCKDCEFSRFDTSTEKYTCHRQYPRRHIEASDFCSYGVSVEDGN